MLGRDGFHRLQRGERGPRQHHLRGAHRRLQGVSEGHRDFVRVAIWGEGKDYCMPCGACRQFLSEFSDSMEVLCAKAGGRYVSYRLNQLLPHTFNY